MTAKIISHILLPKVIADYFADFFADFFPFTRNRFGGPYLSRDGILGKLKNTKTPPNFRWKLKWNTTSSIQIWDFKFQEITNNHLKISYISVDFRFALFKDGLLPTGSGLLAALE